MPTGAHAAAHPVRPKTFTLFLLLLLFSNLSTAQQQININESEALLKFKSSLTDADKSLPDWNTSKTPCSANNANWAGVICFNGHVWGLQLEKMSLKGQLDVDALVPLRFLRTLSFMRNNFGGPMPDWRKLGALKALFLSNNEFVGELQQDAFRGMTSLKKVHLANNKLSGHIPASLESPRLIELRLENNQFTGTIPAISSEHLKLLNVSNNQLDGPIPAPLAKMDPTSFLGNKGLCGKPLDTACDSPAKLGLNNQSSSSPARGTKKIVIIVACTIVGLFLVIALLLSQRRTRTQTSPQLGRAVSARPHTEKSVSSTAQVGGEMVSGSTALKQQQQQSAGTKLSFVREDRRKFDLPDLMRASAEVLGSGSFGASYKAVLVDGAALVVKRFKQMNTIEKEDFHEHMRRLGRLQHPNLLPLVAYLYRKEEKLLVFDLVFNGSLALHLHGKEKPLSCSIRLKIIKGVVKGMVYLRNELPSLTVAHGHLKSSNVLLDKDYNPLLMDYALVPVVNANQVHQILEAYKAPEYTQQGHTNKKTDVWCLGILILETLTGKNLAQASALELAAWTNGIEEAFDKGMEMSSMDKSQMEKLLQIGIACCQEDPDKRWDLDQALNQIEQLHN